MRVCIVGAGIAGLALAALLRKQHINPFVIERAENFKHTGYGVGLYPLGSRVLHGLGLHEEYMLRSAPYDTYELHNGHGELVQTYDVQATFAQYGPLRGITRGDLLSILEEGLDGTEIHFGTTITRIEQGDGEVHATFADGSTGTFDVLVGADGMHSATRAQVLESSEYHEWDTKWGAWVVWIDEPVLKDGSAMEFWGAGNFLGFYPVKDSVMACPGFPKALMQNGKAPAAQIIAEQFGHLSPELLQPLLRALEKDATPFYWDLHDYRSSVWQKGRVVLVGDAACGFLPTAGIGATMALNAAAALADELSRVDATYACNGLKLFVERQKHRTEAAQSKSRQLGELMFVQSKPAAWGRDHLMQFYTPHEFAHDTAKLMAQLS
jgi:2-polyprenyl-6-methoxyphenol hydroxylase-like FAD-dependent oxidoreductase